MTFHPPPPPHRPPLLHHLFPFLSLLLLLLLLLTLPTTTAAAEGGSTGRRVIEVYNPFPFTPEGLIRQLNHAQQAVARGSLSLALTTKEGIILIGEKRQLSPLTLGASPKIGRLDQHIAYIMSGIGPDGRYLVRRGRTLAQRHWFEYGEEIGLPALLLELSKVVTSAHYRLHAPNSPPHKEFFEEIRSTPSVDPLGQAEAETRKEGLPARHFGVGFLFAGPELGCDAPPLGAQGGGDGGLSVAAGRKEEGGEGGGGGETPLSSSSFSNKYPPWVIYEMGPSGLFVRWSARAIGEGSDRAEALLEKQYHPNMSLEECKRLAVQVCESVLLASSMEGRGGESGEKEKEGSGGKVEIPQNLEMACLTRDGKGRPVFVRLSEEEVRGLRAHVTETMGLIDPSSV